MPDPVKLLKQDHTEVKRLFDEFESADGRSKARIASEALTELEVHADIEEEIFYPAISELGGTESMLAEAEQEHHVAHVLIDELRRMQRADDATTYDAKFTVLMENVRHHIKEEESEMLPEAGKVGKDALESIGSQMENRKQALLSEKKQAAAATR